MEEKYSITLPQAAGVVNGQTGSVFFIGTATTLIRVHGFTILTDPNFLHAGDHAHLGYGIKSERLTNPAVEITDLPSVDLCVLSHFHGDHWDEMATRHLRKDLPVVTTGHAAEALHQEGFQNTYALDTWGRMTFWMGERWLRVTAMPGNHGPSLVNFVLPPVMGSLLEWGSGVDAPVFRMYISGDTLVYDDLKEIPQRYPDIPLALLHLGGTRVLGLLVTMDAEQGVQIIQIVQPKNVVPIHYNDYEVFKSPIDDFLLAAQEAGLADRVHFIRHGEAYTFDLRTGGPAASR